jgi:hypothetical protein
MFIKIDNEYRMSYQSDLKPVFETIQEYAENLTWLVAAHNFEYLDNNNLDERLNPKEDFIRITGKELVEIFRNHKIRFKWGVLSGSKSIPTFDKFDYDKWGLKNYSSDGYVYDDADIEIDCYNGLFTIIRTENINIIKKLSEYFMCETKE